MPRKKSLAQRNIPGPNKDQILKDEEESRYNELSHVRAAMFVSMYSCLALILDFVARGNKSLVSQKAGVRDNENAKMLWSGMAIVFAHMIHKLHKVELSKNIKRAVAQERSVIEQILR